MTPLDQPGMAAVATFGRTELTSFSPRRVYGLVLRHLYLLRGSWTRIAELIYWPMINVVMWGFFSRFFVNHSDWVAQAAGVFLGAALLWDVLFRSNLGLSVSFLEEVWSRNLGHLAVSPLTSVELAAALLTMSLIRTVAGMLPSAIGALLLYHFNVFSFGLPLLAFFVNLLITGWAFGLGVSALVLRYGQGAESLAWVIIVAIAPFCGIYYPVATLPVWLQHFAWILPPSHVFEGMRAVAFGGAFPLHQLAITLGLNLVYLAVGAGLFIWVNHIARIRGLFIGMGE